MAPLNRRPWLAPLPQKSIRRMSCWKETPLCVSVNRMRRVSLELVDHHKTRKAEAAPRAVKLM